MQRCWWRNTATPSSCVGSPTRDQRAPRPDARNFFASILVAGTLAAQSPEDVCRVRANTQAEIKRGELLRRADNFQRTYDNCMNQNAGRFGPHVCDTHLAKAQGARQEAQLVQPDYSHCGQPQPTQSQQYNPQQPMSQNYDPARAATNMYGNNRPPVPPQMIPTPGQVAQGVWHGLMNGETVFPTDPNQINTTPAVDYRQQMGGNAGYQNGVSRPGAYAGGGGFPNGARYGGGGAVVRPAPQVRTQPVVPQRRGPQQQPQQGRWVRGRLVH